jgi:hypothetical protein
VDGQSHAREREPFVRSFVGGRLSRLKCHPVPPGARALVKGERKKKNKLDSLPNTHG